MRKNAPRLIAAAIAIAISVYLIFDFLNDVLIEGAPVTSEPIISVALSIARGVTSTVRTFGYPGIFVLMLLESSSLPIPSEVILPFAGYLTAMGQLNGWIIVVIATVAGILGSLIDYYIGLRGVQTLTKHKFWGRVVLSAAQLDVAQRWFDKYGSFMVFASRLIPGFRTVFSFPAGAVKMSMKKFLIFTTAGCVLWNAVLVYFGWYLGKNWTEVAGVSRYLLVAAAAVTLVIVVVYLFVRRRNMQRLKRQRVAEASEA